MALVSQSIKNLKGGISQQPDTLRYPDQGQEQINGWSSEASGLQKRPPAVLIKALGDSAGMGAAPLVHLINRDQFERYYVVFTGTGIRAFDLDGTERQVRGRMDYVSVASPRTSLRMVTVADFTFVVNRTWTVKMLPEKTNGGTYNDKQDALINVRGGQYGRTLEVIFNGAVRAKLKLPDGSNADQSPQTDAQYIAEKLAAMMRGTEPATDPVSWTPLPADWTVTVGESYIHIVAPAGQNIEGLATKDGFANQLISPVTHYSQTFAKLPIVAPDGYMVKITGDTSKGSDAYYVKYDANQKVWKETIGWNVPYMLSNDTMPWTLVRAADGNFDFGPHAWNYRAAGDDVTSPDPSLVDSTINDIFFYRNRLGFLSGENIVMSRTGRYFDFFPASVANLGDDDPIDVAVSHNRISILKYAVPFSEELLLWSDQAQFVLTSQGVLTAKTADLSLTTEFDVQDFARPHGIGRAVYFASPRASFTALNRYYAVQETSQVKSATDCSSYAPSYVPNGVFSINGSGTENFVSILSEGAKNKLFIYKFMYEEEQLLQQSWSHWEWNPEWEILAADSIGSTMYLLMRNGNHTVLNKVSHIKFSTDFPEEPYRVYSDFKRRYFVPADRWNIDTYKTRLNVNELFNIALNHETLMLVADDGYTHEIPAPAGGWQTATDVYVDGDLSNKWYTIGTSIKFRYTFSKFLIKKQADDGSTSTEDSGRLQLRRAWVNYENSGAFTVLVNNGYSQFEYPVVSPRLGSLDMKVGFELLSDLQHRFPIQGNARTNTVTIESYAATPLNIIGCGWEGNYSRRTTGI